MKLQEVRKEKGLSQERLSELSHVDRVSISRYETGKKKPSLFNLKRLAVALGVTADALLDD